jgi:hypothetical protein
MHNQVSLCKEKILHANRALNPLCSEITKGNQCCARFCLSQEPDFLSQREWLREVVENKGHSIIFYPKYHFELNYIEMIWAYIKSYLRKNCTYSYADLQAHVEGIEHIFPIDFVRRAAIHYYRFMDCYRHGLSLGPLADYAMKKYTSHRRSTNDLLDKVKESHAYNENKRRRLY